MNIANIALFENEFNDEELDLISLVSTNANDLNQYLIFKGSNTHSYAIGVSKIEEVLIYDKSINIVKNSDEHSLIMGSADIRESITTLIYFDRWFGNEVLDDDAYELIILTNYGGHKLGIIIKEVANITTIESQEMNYDAQNGSNTLFMSKVSINGDEQMCTIFDSDKLLLDIFEPINIEEIHVHPSKIEKLKHTNVFYADDSSYILTIVEKLFTILEVNYTLFNNGKELLTALKDETTEELDLIIMDFDMPKMGALETIYEIVKMQRHQNTPIIVHTNLSDSIDIKEIFDAGASNIDTQFNPTILCDSMIKELQK